VSLDYEEALKTSRPGTAFSNGTEWECWSANWCDRCLRDAPFRNGISSQGCALILLAMVGERTPGEWLEQPWLDGRPPLERYHCIEFKAPGGGGGEPRPKPEPPDMDGLFERPERRTRMYVQTPAPAPARAVETVMAVGGVL
jgi:hypothetical protein